MTDATGRPGLLQRTRRARLAVLFAALLVTASYAGWVRLEPVFGRTPFEGRLELDHGVVIERVSALAPPVTLLVARVPRGQGLRLRATLLSPDAQASTCSVRPPGAPARSWRSTATTTDWPRASATGRRSPRSSTAARRP